MLQSQFQIMGWKFRVYLYLLSYKFEFTCIINKYDKLKDVVYFVLMLIIIDVIKEE